MSKTEENPLAASQCLLFDEVDLYDASTSESLSDVDESSVVVVVNKSLHFYPWNPVKSWGDDVSIGHHVHVSRSIRFTRIVADIMSIYPIGRCSCCWLIIDRHVAVVTDKHDHSHASMCDFKSLLPLYQWVITYNDVVDSQYLECYAKKIQKWLTTNLCSGLSLEACEKHFTSFSSAFTRLFPYGPEVHLGEMMLLRTSVLKTRSHYDLHGPLIYTADNFRISDAIQGYNAFRSDVTYGTTEGLKVVKSQFYSQDDGLCGFDRNCPIKVAGLSRTHDIMYATFGESTYEETLCRFDCDDSWQPNARTVYDCSRSNTMLTAWFNRLLLAPHVSVSCIDQVKRCIFKLIAWNDPTTVEDLIVCILTLQWFADAFCAAHDIWWPNPYSARIYAAGMVLTNHCRMHPHYENEVPSFHVFLTTRHAGV